MDRTPAGRGDPSPSPPSSRARVGAAQVTCVLRAAQECGLDLPRLGVALDAGGLVPVAADAIPVEDHLRLLETAAALLGDPYFGLQVGRRMRATDATGYAMVLLSAPDLRAVLEATERFEPLAHDLGRTTFERTGRSVRVIWRTPWRALPGARHLVEANVAGLRAVIDWLVEATIPCETVHFAHAPPDGVDPAIHEAFFAAPVCFGAPFDGFVLPAEALDLPVRNRDPVLFTQALAAAERRLGPLAGQDGDAPSIAALERAVRDGFASGRTRVQDLAAAVGMAPRTLQRRLAELGTSHSRLMDEVRRTLAREWVADETLPLTEVALMLGFTEQSSFNHAFRRWYGVAPGALRADPAGGGPPQKAAKRGARSRASVGVVPNQPR
ncbi:MAG: AraC family transcriptional regulator [Siculibacillus sp.]|nr:AraC family transcriptional regulator [Siculibacillus sp.]